MIKKIHQLSKTKDLKDFEVDSQRKLTELNKDYEYKLWDDEDLKYLFENSYPELFEAWDKMKGVQRADLGRYLILYLEGGFYCDTDFYINQSLDSLGELTETYFSPSTPDFLFMEAGFTNYFIYSPSGDKIFIKAIEESLKRIRETSNYNQPSYISYTTGKILLTKIVKDNNYKVNIFLQKDIVDKSCECTETKNVIGYHNGGTSRLNKKDSWLNKKLLYIIEIECNLRKKIRVKGNLCQVPVIFIFSFFLLIILGYFSFKKYRRIYKKAS